SRPDYTRARAVGIVTPTSSVVQTGPGPASTSVALVAYDLAVIGGGNMGAALLGGLLHGGVIAPDQVVIVESYPERRDALQSMFPGVAISDRVSPCTSAVLCVKPPDIAGVATEAAAAGATRVLSIAAGVRIAAIERADVHGVGRARGACDT